MRYSLVLLALCLACSTNVKVNSMNTSDSSGFISTDFYDLSFVSITGKDTISMSSYKGKKVLIVNVASKCGYTPQYEELQSLYEKYGDKLEIIGFPCNQFMGQEPGTIEEIATFCKLNYGVTFPLAEKVEVKGNNQHPVYQWLTKKELNGQSDHNVSWNFNKFLISESGNLIAYFGSGIKPMSEEILSKL